MCNKLIHYRHKNGTVVLAVILLLGGCARSEFQIGQPRRDAGPRVDDALIAHAPEAKMPKVAHTTYFAAGRLFESQGQLQKAAAQYRKAIATQRDYLPAIHRLALVLSLLGKHEEALAWFRKATQLEPENAVLFNNLGYELMLRGQWSEAGEAFNRAIELDHRFARPYINRGMALSKVGRFDEALASFRRVLPEEDAQYNLGLMYRGQHRYREAADAFARAIEINPAFSAAVAQIERITPKLEQARWNEAVAEVPVENRYPALPPSPAARDSEAFRLAENGIKIEPVDAFAARQFEQWVRESETPTSPAEAFHRWLAQAAWLPGPALVSSTYGRTEASGPFPLDELERTLAVVGDRIDCMDDIGQVELAGTGGMLGPCGVEGTPCWCEADVAFASSLSDEEWAVFEEMSEHASSPANWTFSPVRPTMGMTVIEEPENAGPSEQQDGFDATTPERQRPVPSPNRRDQDQADQPDSSSGPQSSTIVPGRRGQARAANVRGKTSWVGSRRNAKMSSDSEAAAIDEIIARMLREALETDRGPAFDRGSVLSPPGSSYDPSPHGRLRPIPD